MLKYTVFGVRVFLHQKLYDAGMRAEKIPKPNFTFEHSVFIIRTAGQKMLYFLTLKILSIQRRGETIMMKICTCEACKYTFRYPLLPLHCPDCGRSAVRDATGEEIKEFYHLQEILAEEIRSGIYGAAAAG